MIVRIVVMMIVGMIHNFDIIVIFKYFCTVFCDFGSPWRSFWEPWGSFWRLQGVTLDPWGGFWRKIGPKSSGVETRTDFLVTFGHFLDLCLRAVLDDFSIIVFFYEKSWFVANRIITSMRASLLKVRGRFGGVQERPEWAKIAPGTLEKHIIKSKLKNKETQKIMKKRTSQICCYFNGKLMFSRCDHA